MKKLSIIRFKPKPESFDEILEKATSFEMSHLVIPFLHAHERESLDNYKRLAELMNRAATKAASAGIQLAYHNHNFEFLKLEAGKTPLDVFKEEFSDEMQFELDVFWAQVAGMDTIQLMQDLEGRISQLHLKDLKAGVQIPLYDTSDMSKEDFKELGNGVIQMTPIIEAAWVAGVDHCHVEQDHSPNPIVSIRQSLAHLATL